MQGGVKWFGFFFASDEVMRCWNFPKCPELSLGIFSTTKKTCQQEAQQLLSLTAGGAFFLSSERGSADHQGGMVCKKWESSLKFLVPGSLTVCP